MRIISKPKTLRFHDLERQRFGQLTVSGFAGVTRGVTTWYCRCDCGDVSVYRAGNLRSGNSTRCRACSYAVISNKATTHGKTGTATYRVWAAMVQRCTDPHVKGYDRYGGRGIKVCPRWMQFENFLADMGERPTGMSIDRQNNSQGYNPENCRWATAKQQTRNRSVTPQYTHNGVTMSLADWAEHVNIPYKVLHNRIHTYGWAIAEAFTRPLRVRVKLSAEVHRQHRQARKAVFDAIKRGELQKPVVCACGKPDPQGHHHNGYAIEHQLDVVWLCRECHERQAVMAQQFGKQGAAMAYRPMRGLNIRPQ